MTDTPEDNTSQSAEDDPWSEDADLGLAPLEPVEADIAEEFDEEDFDDDFDDDFDADFEEEDDDGYESPVGEDEKAGIPVDDDDDDEIDEPFEE